MRSSHVSHLLQVLSSDVLRFRRGLLCATLFAFLGLGAVGCGSGSTADDSRAESGAVVADELAPGTYTGTVTNETRGNGPYTLQCDRYASQVTVHFDNGGFVAIEIESEERTSEGLWEIRGTESRSGDEWSISIQE